jgi:ADP-ribose pyrophosphatase
MAEATGAGRAPEPGPGPAAGRGAGPAGLRDQPERWPVAASAELPGGRFLHLRQDTVVMPGGNDAVREFIEHPGAVAIAALWELPAGLRDVAGEPLLRAAQRELLEETGHRAADWQVLADVLASPGCSTERVRIFLARGVTEVPAAEQDYVRTDEEASLLVEWVPLDAAVRGFLAGDLHNGVTGVGILSAYAAVTGGFGPLRDTGAPEAW